MKTVSIRNPGMSWDIAANILVPPGFDEGKRYPAVISNHPIGSCKEQTAGNVYGAALATAGFVVIVPDASFQGGSGGEPRWLEDPEQRVRDYRDVVDYAQSLPFVDPERIGMLGICGGGGYSIKATIIDKRIKALVSITGVNFGRLMREGFSNFDPLGALEGMAAQRTAENGGAKEDINIFVPGSVEEAKAAGIKDIDVLGATDYYRNRCPAEGAGTRMLVSHAAPAVAWDAFAFAETLLTQPLMVVFGDKPGGFGAYRDGMEIYGRAASKDKELVVIEGWSHYDLYDNAVPTGIALDRLVPFFKRHLSDMPAGSATNPAEANH
ncbi:MULTISPECIES: alpha/beta hydrolase [Acetobacteraceae]|uniref:Alpha/beta hydrolase n=1 Tax=Kozakia baliensis TaxID=153496 RepID=A0A1D8UYH5_9PROT|nr:alpha/beta hydrolase [Kozakia baliensis]AOX18690.1 alpha/beta hydrolase [Kozakia baliensis]GBR33139.1 putative hydrolase [Kozakia baliensis NRIC 0488]GEL65284.1 alpha/beta hydrolase [Kozakia baliensis]